MLARGDTDKNVILDTSLRRNSNASSSLPSKHQALELPLELLQKIFLFLVNLPVAQLYFYSPGRPDWIAITYVCRYWRSTALSQPELWSSINPDLSLSWSRAMTERSAPLPMRIDIHVGPCFAGGFESLAASELLPSASRICSLRLSGYTTDVLTVLNCLSSPSSLESLSLWVTGTGEPVDLPEAMCNRDAPYLHCLTLEAPTCVRAPVWLLAGVTHFTTSASVSLYEFLRTLQAMPQLEMLCIEEFVRNAWSVINPPEQVPFPRAVLPHLSLLSFRGIIINNFVVLSSLIDAPPTLRRHIFWFAGSVSSWDSWVNKFTDLQAFIPDDSAPGVDDGGLRVARVVGGYEDNSIEVWSRTGAKSTIAPVREDALFLFHIRWSGSVSGALGAGGMYSTLISFSSFAHLRVACIEDLSIAPETADESFGIAGHKADTPYTLDIAAKLRTQLAAWSSVKTLRLHGGGLTCVSVLRGLSASADPLFPHLQRIFVVRCAVHHGATACPDGGSVSVAGSGPVLTSSKFVGENLGVELVEVVAKRSGIEVVLVGCEVDEEALDTLRKRARVVIGDEQAYV
ncbi:hypothetical protein EDB92DRAFT_2089031 [Lactarius akahatsu]|uniref:F-box domain-containing protein n=1 Tax=Lactarius akahatsu TaxID=416441 RepID=A0AAD4LG42_9AGAM|nr:hypothetical protein EDB92DRAFT_2089031 [Lactarius akahatsu]